jgi:hypothetical protein
MMHRKGIGPFHCRSRMFSKWSPAIRAQSPARLVALVWLCFVLRGFFYCGFVPMWEGFDEWAHYGYIDYLERHSRLSLSSEPVSREIEESLKVLPVPWIFRLQHPSLTTHDDYWKLPEPERRIREEKLRNLKPGDAQATPDSQFKLYEAQQPPLYYLLLYLPHKATADWPLASRVYVLRFLSVLLASLVIPLGFAAARMALGAWLPSLKLAAFLAVMPELLINVARVGNESLSIPVFTGLVYCCLRLLRSKAAAGYALSSGLLLGLGLLTKAYFLAAVPVLLLVFAWSWITRPRERRVIAAHAACALLLAGILSGWWYWRNQRVTGSWSGHMFDAQMKDAGRISLLQNITRVRWYQAVETTFFSHVWFGNWSFLQVRSWIYRLARWAAVLIIAGIFLLVWRLRRGKTGPPIRAEDLFLLLLFYLFFALSLAYYVLIAFGATGFSASQGWYLYCVIVPELVLAAVGYQAVLGKKYGAVAFEMSGTLFAALDLYTVHLILVPYYTGLLAHNAKGALPGFYPAIYADGGVSAVFDRMAVNKAAFLTPGVLAVLWLCYLASTAVLVWIMLLLPAAEKEAAG